MFFTLKKKRVGIYIKKILRCDSIIFFTNTYKKNKIKYFLEVNISLYTNSKVNFFKKKYERISTNYLIYKLILTLKLHFLILIEILSKYISFFIA